MNRLNTSIAVFFITLFFVQVAFAQVDTLKVYSEVMKKTILNTVITPKNYNKSKEKKPVLYLLHGAGGDYKDWISKVPSIQSYTNELDIIIVCPDGGKTSWYFDSPKDETMQYETYVSKELTKAVETQYATFSNKENRAITGLSMGGHGALYLALKHQDIWGAAGSMSGGVDIRPFPNNWDIKKRLGTYSQNKNVWEENTVINMLHLIDSDIKLIIDCGYDDFFFEDNRRLHDNLLERNIKHEYIERPGVHNWDYWRNAIQHQILYFNNFFTRK